MAKKSVGKKSKAGTKGRRDAQKKARVGTTGRKAARPAVSPKRASAKASVSAKAGKYVYLFGKKTDGNGQMKPLLGGKGANLAEMCRIGLPVPPGFTVTTEVCTYF
jgi:pyruvate, orthophosphate dikinase